VELVENPRRAAKRAGFFFIRRWRSRGTFWWTSGNGFFLFTIWWKPGGGMWKTLWERWRSPRRFLSPLITVDGGKEENFPWSAGGNRVGSRWKLAEKRPPAA